MDIGPRLKQLLEEKGLNKAEFARKMGISPQGLNGMFGRKSIETKTLQKICNLLGVSVTYFFEGQDAQPPPQPQKSGLVPVYLNNAEEPVIPILNKQAAAGYPAHTGDPAFFEELPYFTHPHLTDGQYFCVQVRGDSMEPSLFANDYVVARWVDSLSDLQQDQVYVVVTADGVVVKRLSWPDEPEHLLLRSDNPDYSPYQVHANEVLELWEVRLRMSWFSGKQADTFTNRLASLEEQVQQLKSLLDR